MIKFCVVSVEKTVLSMSDELKLLLLIIVILIQLNMYCIKKSPKVAHGDFKYTHRGKFKNNTRLSAELDERTLDKKILCRLSNSLELSQSGHSSLINHHKTVKTLLILKIHIDITKFSI